MNSRKYELPEFLKTILTFGEYEHWLDGKAQSHRRRDKRRGKRARGYKERIHQAVLSSKGRDFYTHEDLEWCRVKEKYDSKKAQDRGSAYRRDLALYPTVDHEDPESEDPVFRICGLRTNDCKSDLTVEEFKQFSKKVLEAQGCKTSADC